MLLIKVTFGNKSTLKIDMKTKQLTLNVTTTNGKISILHKGDFVVWIMQEE